MTRANGGGAQAIHCPTGDLQGKSAERGRSRGGRTTRVHALTDEIGRPLARCLTPGQAHDLTGAAMLLERIPTPRRLRADRAYDARRLRDWLAERGCEAVIPPNPTRKHPHTYSLTMQN